MADIITLHTQLTEEIRLERIMELASKVILKADIDLKLFTTMDVLNEMLPDLDFEEYELMSSMLCAAMMILQDRMLFTEPGNDNA